MTIDFLASESIDLLPIHKFSFQSVPPSPASWNG